MTSPADPRTALATLRPQAFGDRSSSKITDPIVEPLWIGVRVLAAVDSLGAVFADEFGEPILEHEPVRDALAAATMADGLVVDGFLTKQIARDTTGIHTSSILYDQVPTAGRIIAGQMFGMRRDRTEERMKARQETAEARTFAPDDEITFVAIDLLWLDGESLLDLPLLERRRLLDSVLVESDEVRRGTYLRPPIDTWVSSWKSQGFGGVTFKAANSRYQPGVASLEWTTAPMPRR